MKRIVLFVLTNIAVMVVVGIICNYHNHKHKRCII